MIGDSDDATFIFLLDAEPYDQTKEQIYKLLKTKW
jgi:hypothetical protein